MTIYISSSLDKEDLCVKLTTNMKGFLLFLQLFSAFALIITILLHTAKGEGLGGIGGQAKLFGAQKGLEEGLNRITAACAVAFLIVSVILAAIGA